MTTQYEFVRRMSQLYDMLQDDLSRTLFWDRLRLDIEPCLENVIDLYADAFHLDDAHKKEQYDIRERLIQLAKQGKQVLLYGAGACGYGLARLLEYGNIPFYGFCDRKAKTISGEAIKKPVYPPEYLFEHKDKCYVIISTIDHNSEIREYLLENGFYDNHIIPVFMFDSTGLTCERQYFSFPELIRPGTAFVDAGCFDGADSLYYAQCCKGNYSKIYAFEPDAENAEQCRQNAKKWSLEKFELIQAGVSKSSGETMFTTGKGSASHIVNASGDSVRGHTETNRITQGIKLCTIDEMLQSETIGFIKMDIEGAELDALEGAQNTILRDKPLLAICIYHKSGDMLAIMEYLHTLIPEYRFWIRHYTTLQYETVLYASI